MADRFRQNKQPSHRGLFAYYRLRDNWGELKKLLLLRLQVHLNVQMAVTAIVVRY